MHLMSSLFSPGHRLVGWLRLLTLVVAISCGPSITHFASATEATVGPGAAEPTSPAAWYGEGVRSSEKRTPEEERLGFHLPPGFVIELVASEPQIAKPLNMAFDARGKLWVTQTVEYPYPVQGDDAARDAIKTLEDTDGDGRFDRVRTFAEGLNIPMGLLPYRDGVLAFSIPNIIYLADTDGDGVCDKREVILGPFDTTRDTHGMVNAMRRGDDGWIYACHGFNNQSIVRGRDGHEVRLTSGNTFRFRPDGSRVEQFTSGQVNPFGMTVDRWGNRITADCHSKPLTCLFPGASYPSFGRPHDGLGFFPSMMDHTHGSTAISGVEIYEASGFPESYRGQIYSGNVMTSRINRDHLQRVGATMIAREVPDFLTSDDPWFRPVDIQLGPDGSLYVADFYNRIIGHYEVPLDHPGRDRDSGRIWRIRHENDKSEPLAVAPSDATSGAPLESIFDQLGHANIRRRQLALDALTDLAMAKSTEASNGGSTNDDAPSLIVRSAKARLHANAELDAAGSLWLLHRIGQLTPMQLTSLLEHPSTLVQASALRAIWESGERMGNDATTPILVSVRRSLQSDAPEVASWAGMALARIGDRSDVTLIARRILQVSEEDPMLRARLRIAVRDLISRRIDSLQLLESGEWSHEIKTVVFDVMLGVTNPAVVDAIMRSLADKGRSLDDSLPLIRHAAKIADDQKLDQLIAALRNRAGDERSSGTKLFRELRDVTVGRNSQALTAWAEQYVIDALDAVQKAARAGELTSMWKANAGKEWAFENRAADDKQNEHRYRSSFTLGENYTGVMTSPSFVAGDRFAFWIVGHNGFPAAEDSKLNHVRLVHVKTGEVLQEAFPPRSDTAAPVNWDLSQWQGQPLFLEVHDGDGGSAYAWIAAGRFSEPSLDHSNQLDDWRDAIALMEAYRLPGAVNPLRTLVADKRLDVAMRLEGAICLSKVNGDASGEVVGWALSTLGHHADHAEATQSFLETVSASALERRSSNAFHRDLLKSLSSSLPQRNQLELARRLAASGELAPWLLQGVEEGWLAADLLADKTVETSLESTLDEESKTRMLAIKATLAPVDDEHQAFRDEVLRQSQAMAGDLQRGDAIYQKHCAGCHQLKGQGALVGPQLDGVGARDYERLLEDIVLPDRNVDKAFRTTSFLLDDGAVQVGLLKTETDTMIELVDNTGKTIQIDAAAVVSRKANLRSLMPQGLHETIGPSGLVDLLAYLRATAGQKP
jgi:putative heme-binding domain-containing protein